MWGLQNWGKIAILGLGIRVAFILLLSQHEDLYQQQFKLTDIDYKVYSDATTYSSPYDRHTYRYSPLLAYLMAFNYTHHSSIGKIILALFDFIATALLYQVAARHSQAKNGIKYGVLSAKAYAYNPLFIYLTVRGSCESITMALIYGFLSLYWGGRGSGNHIIAQMHANKVYENQPCRWRRWGSYVIYGLLVHFRVFPIIFVPLLVMHQYHLGQKKIAALFKAVLEIGIVGGGVFLALAGLFYSLYGWDFIEQTYLYHWYRQDNRHSISPFFYQIYLNFRPSTNTFSRNLIRSIPTLYTLLTLSFRFVRNHSLYNLLFLTTTAFVMFNRVITMQYYMWVLGTVILVLPQHLIYTQKRYRMGLSYAIQYVFPLLVWVWLSLRLQNNGENYLHTMWLIGLFTVFFQLWVLVSFIKTTQRWNPISDKQQKLQAAQRLLTGKQD